MPTELVSPDVFIARLTSAFEASSSTSSVWLTHKRLSRSNGDVRMASTDDTKETHEILLRCTVGSSSSSSSSKFSTHIPPSSLFDYLTTYSNLLKASLAPSMRKRDKKQQRQRQEAAQVRRRQLYEDVDLSSAAGLKGKRGKGRRQRQRKVRAQLKKEGERERVEKREKEAAKAAKKLAATAATGGH